MDELDKLANKRTCSIAGLYLAKRKKQKATIPKQQIGLCKALSIFFREDFLQKFKTFFNNC